MRKRICLVGSRSWVVKFLICVIRMSTSRQRSNWVQWYQPTFYDLDYAENDICQLYKLSENKQPLLFTCTWKQGLWNIDVKNILIKRNLSRYSSIWRFKLIWFISSWQFFVFFFFFFFCSDVTRMKIHL